MAALILTAGATNAGATQIDLSKYVNSNAGGYTSGANYPTGSTTIGGVSFALASIDGAGPAVIQTPTTAPVTIGGLDVLDADVAYTIINSAIGQRGQDVGTITFTGALGATVSFDLIEGQNIRDHYYGMYNNVATDLYATTGYQNGTEVPDGPGLAHFDVQRFDLSGLMGQDLASITFNGTNPGGGEPFLAAVTTANLPAGVPEPASWALMLGGFGLVGAGMRQARERKPAFT